MSRVSRVTRMLQTRCAGHIRRVSAPAAAGWLRLRPGLVPPPTPQLRRSWPGKYRANVGKHETIPEQFQLQGIADVAVTPGVREEGIRGFVCFHHWCLSQAQIRWWWCHHYLAFWPGKYISLAGEYKLPISPSDGAEGGARLQPAETQGVGGDFSPETEICSNSHTVRGM